MPVSPPIRATLLSLACVALPATVHAAGMNCARAASATEKAICASPELIERDTRLAQTYGRLLGVDPEQSAAVRQSQRTWLQSRNRCGANDTCLRNSYDERSAALSTQLQIATAYQPDDTDLQAAEDLRAAVAEQLKKTPDFPLENALKRVAIPAADMTGFANERAPDSSDPAQFPTTRPEGVSENEWRALVATHIETEGENGNTRYALMDLDGDGKRDLVIDEYVGGTGLFSYTSALRRIGDKFEAAGGTHSDATGGSALYSLNGRGANQDATWVRLRGRVYAAYRVGYYGVDTVYLMRALKSVGVVPAVTVHYRYDLQVPRVQVDENAKTSTTLDEGLHRALSNALAKALPKISAAKDRQPTSTRTPICPIPAGTAEDDRGTYFGLGPGHYTFEIVADFPVQKDGVCHVGRLIDWFGGYDAKTGLFAQVSIARPGAGESNIKTYDVTGKRTATDVSTTVKPIEGDNGA